MESKKKTKVSEVPFKLLCIARSNYGKTLLTTAFVMDKVKRKVVNAKRIMIFSKTFKSDTAQQDMIKYLQSTVKSYKFQENNCFEAIDMAVITTIYNSLKLQKEQSGMMPKPWIIYLDDVISEAMLTQRNSPFVSIFSTMRHYNMSMCILLQSYKAIQPSMRNQATIVAIGQLSSQSACEDILDEYDYGLGETKYQAHRKMKDFYNEAISSHNNHGFLVINTQQAVGDHKFQINFDEQYLD